MGFSLKKLGSQIFDQVNPLDNGRTFQQRTPTNNKSVYQQAQSFSPPPVVVARTLGKTLQRTTPNIPTFSDSNPLRFANNAFINPTKITGLNVSKALQGDNPYKGNLRQQSGQAIQDAINLSAALPVGKGAQLATKGAGAIRVGLKQGAKVGAGFGAAQGVATSNKENMNLKDTAKTVALNTVIGGTGGTVLGGGLPVAGMGIKQASKGIVNASQGIKNLVDNRVPLNQAGGMKVSAALEELQKKRVEIQKGWDNGNKVVRKQAEKGLKSIDKAIKEQRKLDEGGFINPFSKTDNLNYSSGDGLTKVSGKADAVRAKLQQEQPPQIQNPLTGEWIPDPTFNPNGGFARLGKAKVSQKQAQAPEAPTPAQSPVDSLPNNTRVPLEVTNKNTLMGEFQQGFVDKDAPIINYLKKVEKQNNKKGLVDQFVYDTGLQRRSNAIANAQIQGSSNINKAFKGLVGDEKKTFDSYVAARQEISNAERGLPTSAPVDDLKKVVAGSAHHEERFNALNRSYKEWADKLHKAGIIDDATHKSFNANNDYTHVQRIMDDLASYGGGTGNSFSLGQSLTRLKRKGSSRDIQPADATAFKYGQDVQNEIQRNQTASNLIDVLMSQGHARNLVNADDVTFRRDMWKFLSSTREGKVVTDRLLKIHGKQARKLQSEVDQLNKQGLDIRLGQDVPTVDKPVLSGVRDKIANPRTIEGKKTQPLLNSKPLTGTVQTDQFSRSLTTKETKDLVNSLIAKDPTELRRIKNKLSIREPRLKALVDEVEQLQNTSEAFRTARKEAYNAAVARADLSTTGKNTLKRIRNGITEVYEVPRDIKELADNISPYQLGILGRIVSAPQRLLRAGATGLSLPFTAANYVKDQVSSGIYSKDVMATHQPANIMTGLYQSAKDFGVGTNDPLWQKFITHLGDTTQYDFIRNAKNTKQLSRELRLGQAGRTANRGLHPIRTLEDLNQVTEKATRFQNFKGTYNKAIKEGLSESEATQKATLAAWQNSVDFSRMGHVGQAINLLIPYFNAGIQGTRLLGRRMTDAPAATASKTIGFVGLPLAGATLYNLENRERKKVYDNISDFEKNNNIIVVLPGAKQHEDGSYSGVIKVPLQPGMSNLVQPIRMSIESYAHGNPQDVAAMSKQFFGAMAGPINTSSASALAGSLTPQVVKPFVQQVANKDLFTGKPIVPDYVEKATDGNGNPVKETDKTYKYTSGTARAIGNATGQSPIRVEKFIKDASAKVGMYSINTLDNALAKAGAIPKEQIGGVSAKEDLYRRFAVAQGKENFKKSAGAKYYDNIKKETAGLTGNELAAFNALHPTKKNFKGDTIYTADKVYDPAARLDTYNRYPKVFEVDKRLDAKNKNRNPLFSLEPWQVKKVLEKDNLPPGAKDPELSNLYSQPWYSDYATKRSAYFTASKKAAEKAGKPFGKSDNPYPETPADLQKVMDTYSALPKGSGARSAWIKSNPGAWAAMTKQFAMIDNWQNVQRGKRGLDMTEGDVGKTAGYGDSSSSYAKGGGSKNDNGYTGDPYKYAVSLSSGKQPPKPKVYKASKGKKVAKKSANIKVSLKKSKV